jgi:hypothetical protein
VPSAAPALNALDASPTDRATRTAKDKEFRLLCMITPNDSGGTSSDKRSSTESQLKFTVGDERYAERNTPAEPVAHRETLKRANFPRSGKQDGRPEAPLRSLLEQLA